MLHPQARALIDLMIERKVPPTHTLSPADARSAYRDRRALTQLAPEPVASVQDLQADGPHGPIGMRLYRPTQVRDPSRALPVLVYFHGGGWVIGDLETHDCLCRQLCNAAACAVLAVDYRLAPEHRFPSAVDDCLAATRWCRDHATQLQLDPTRMAVGGDSAGGNLAAVVALATRDAGDPPLRLQLLIYPATDMRCGAPSHTINGQGYLLTRDSLAYFKRHYLDGADELDWRASPLLREDLRGVAEACVLTAGYDPLRDEGLQYSQRLTEAGNGSTYLCFERQVHGFITMDRVLDETQVAVTMLAAVLARALHRP